MYYKKDDNGKWWGATNVHLPSGDVLTPENKLNLDGWEWLDNPPEDYLEYIENQKNEL